jgi:serine/threonine protein phosphatase Stp1
MMVPLRIEDTAATHVGKVRSENEDSLLSDGDAGVWLVADGMGGHANGRYASHTITSALDTQHFPEDLEDACEAVADAVLTANAQIFERSLELGVQMGSTFVSLVVRDREFAVMWAGDSRAYLFRNNELILLTRDHTQVEMMIERGLLAPEDAETHPMKHVLARAVGVQEELLIDAIRDTVEPRDIFLLCSDGLHSVIGEDRIVELLRTREHDAPEAMIEACLANGAPDNVTVAVVAVREPTLLALNGAQP